MPGWRWHGQPNASGQASATGAARGRKVASVTGRATTGAEKASQPWIAPEASTPTSRTTSAPEDGVSVRVRHDASCAASVSASVPAGSTVSPDRRPYSAMSVMPSARLPAAITVTVPAVRSGSVYQEVVT